MATKTISIDLEAYERLRKARRSATESFSKVIKRARWSEPPRAAGSFLDGLQSLPPVSEEAISRWEQAQAQDAPPDDPWTDSPREGQ